MSFMESSKLNKAVNSFRPAAWGRKFIRKNTRELMYWCLFVCLVLVGYKFFSDGSFSAVLTLSSAFQCFAFLLLLVKVQMQSSVAGISKKSLMLYVVSLSCRLFSTLFFNGYLPVDRSGDWVYQVSDISAVLSILCLLYMISSKFSHSYQSQHDTFNISIPVVISAVFAVLVRPDLNNYIPADYAWTFALYLETSGMIPQLLMLTKLGGEVEALTSHYVASLAGSKIFTFVFWLFSFRELAPRSGMNFAGYGVIGAYFIQILLFADFLYHYVNSLRLGRALIIPNSVV